LPLEQDLEKPEPSTALTRLSRLLPAWVHRYWHVNWTLADQAMLSGVNFLTGILLARYLGVTEFGIFTLAWLIVEFVQGIQSTLIIMPMMTIGPKQAEHEQTDYYGSVLAQQTAIAVCSTLLFLVGITVASRWFPDWNLDALTWPLAAAVLVGQYQNFVRRYFFAFGHPVVAFFVDFVRYGGQIAILFWLLLTVEMDAARTLWVIAGTALASALLAAFFYGTVTWNGPYFRATLARHWTFSRWLLLSELMRWATGNFYMFVAGGLIGAAAVGAIRAAQNLVGLSHILLLGLENIVPAGAARQLSRNGKAAFLRYMKRVTVLGSLAIGGICLIAAAAPELWLELIYGKEYTGNGHLVRWWAVIYFVAFLADQLSFGLRTLEHTKSVFWAHLATAILSLVTVYPLIAYLGETGVMIGLLSIVLLRIAVLALGFFSKLRKLRE
jgi:O-antigen/teichoic acid export membrane protein